MCHLLKDKWKLMMHNKNAFYLILRKKTEQKNSRREKTTQKTQKVNTKQMLSPAVALMNYIDQ